MLSLLNKVWAFLAGAMAGLGILFGFIPAVSSFQTATSTSLTWTVSTTTSQTVTSKPATKPVFASKPVSKPLPQSKPFATTTPTTPVSTTPSIPRPDPTALNLATRGAVVNILCVTKSGGPLAPISGSGVVIDSRGVILTNAHVAQYMLLRDFGVPNFITCVARTGSPASPAYTLDLLYISPRWVRANANEIQQEKAEGSGEYDYALLVARDPIGTPPPLISTTPDVEFNDAAVDQQVLMVSYPAELIGSVLTQTGLNEVSTVGAMKQGFYFPGNTPADLDIFSVGGSIVAQGGSSGGAVVNKDTGKLVGILVTSTAAETTNDKDLRALTLSHINRSLQQETGQSLAQFISGSLDEKINTFATTQYRDLRRLLIDVILGISTSTPSH